MAFKNGTSVIATPQASDFAVLWAEIKGDDGNPGDDGMDASDNDGIALLPMIMHLHALGAQ